MCEKNDIDILFIADTGLNEISTASANNYFPPNNMYNGKFYAPDHRWTDATGTGIIWRKRLDHVFHAKIEERGISVEIKEDESTMKILGIYAPPSLKGSNEKPSGRISWTKTMEDLIDVQKPTLIMGDMNEWSDLGLDYSGSRRQARSAAENPFLSCLKERGMIDTFRHIHPYKKMYTFIRDFQNGNHMYNRIDHIMIDSLNIEKLLDADILSENDCRSDHRVVTCRISTKIGGKKEGEKQQAKLITRNLPESKWKIDFRKALENEEKIQEK